MTRLLVALHDGASVVQVSVGSLDFRTVVLATGCRPVIAWW
jgi:hypothetical protein